MAATTRSTFWCHQCHRQTRPIAGEEVICTYCNGGFVEEMETTEVEPGMTFSSLPFNLASLFGLPFPVLSPSGNGAPSGASNGEGIQIQRHRPRLMSGHHPEVSQLLGTVTNIVRQLPDQPVNNDERNGHYQVGGTDTRDIHAPGSRMLIMQGEVPNFFGGLGSIEVFIDNGVGAGPQLLPGHIGDFFLGPELDRLIQLLGENDPNRYGTPPASRAAVDAMPAVKITEEHLRTEVMQCAVCKDDFELGTEARQMPCKHIYHADCILPWLSLHSTCPVCRFEMPTDESDDSSRRQHGSSESSSDRTGRNVADESNAVGSDRGDAETGRSQERNGQRRLSRQFTLMGMPGMDSSSSFVEGTNDPNPSNEGAQTHSLLSGREIDQEGSNPRGMAGGSPNPVPWLFRLFSSLISSPVEASVGNEVDRTNSVSSTPGANTNERTPGTGTDTDFAGMKQEDLD